MPLPSAAGARQGTRHATIPRHNPAELVGLGGPDLAIPRRYRVKQGSVRSRRVLSKRLPKKERASLRVNLGRVMHDNLHRLARDRTAVLDAMATNNEYLAWL